MKSLLFIPFLLLFATFAFSHNTTDVTPPQIAHGEPSSPAHTDAILNDLIELGIVKTKAKASFLLEKDRLIVNDVWQDKSVLTYFVQKYKIDKVSTWVVYNYSM